MLELERIEQLKEYRIMMQIEHRAKISFSFVILLLLKNALKFRYLKFEEMEKYYDALVRLLPQLMLNLPQKKYI